MTQILDWEEIFSPVQDLFSTSQVQMLLLAWLPLKFGDYFQTGIHAIDMFLVTVAASIITALLTAGYELSSSIKELFNWQRGKLSVQIDYYRPSPWGDVIHNKYYAAAAWMISSGSSGLDSGNFLIVPEACYDDEEKMLAFDVLPNKMSCCDILYKGEEYTICFQDVPDSPKADKDDDSAKAKIPPSIIITPKKTQPVSWCKEFLEELYKDFVAYERTKRERSRYDYDDYWFHVLDLHPNLGLKSVALDKEQEVKLLRDIKSFTANKAFYAKIGLPYRRGYLFYGKPGTGKTSLIHAIASELDRDLYYLNLKSISTDAALQAAFAGVPKNSIIVFEDIDAMSRVCHKRSSITTASMIPSTTALAMASSGSEEAKDSSSLSKKTMDTSSFTLSCLLNCLDGHVMQSGNIVIMTTNHPEVLDPALIRAGRIDLKLELGYTTRYQITRMYDNIVKSSFELEEVVPELDENWLSSKFVEGIVPPCEVLRDMLLYRLEPLEIPSKLQALVEKYSNGARSAEEEEEEQRRTELAELEAAKALEKQSKDNSSDKDNDDD